MFSLVGFILQRHCGNSFQAGIRGGESKVGSINKVIGIGENLGKGKVKGRAFIFILFPKGLSVY